MQQLIWTHFYNFLSIEKCVPNKKLGIWENLLITYLSLFSHISTLKVFERAYDKCAWSFYKPLLAYFNKLYGEAYKKILIK